MNVFRKTSLCFSLDSLHTVLAYIQGTVRSLKEEKKYGLGKERKKLRKNYTDVVLPFVTVVAVVKAPSQVVSEPLCTLLNFARKS